MKESKAAKNKELKEAKLYNAAYDLFTSKGINDTSIDDIVKKAGVAKGTFYLYFKDKYDLIDRIMFQKSSAVVRHAMLAVRENEEKKHLGFIENVIFFIDYLVEYFKEHSELLVIIYKNLSWGLFKEAQNEGEIADVVQQFVTDYTARGVNAEAAQKRLYLIVEMIGSACYNSIVLKAPYRIDDMKQEMYQVVRKILS